MSDVVSNLDFHFLINFEDLDDLSLSQALNRYEITEENLGDFNDIDFGDFDLLSKHENAEISDGKRFQSVKKSGNDDFKQLIANQESKNIWRNTNWAKRTWDERTV